MYLYVRNQGCQTPNRITIKDIIKNSGNTLSDETFAKYLNVLEKIFVIEEMYVWNPNLRSKTAIRTSNTRYFIDPSIAAASLNIGPNDLINDLNTFDFLFEAMCIHDLRTYADALNGSVYHYRDKNNL